MTIKDRTMISYDEKRQCLDREIKMRKRVYPRWVSDGRMSQAKADKEIAIMQAILDDYPQRQGELL